MTQLTSDAASDSLYPAIQDTSVRSPQVTHTSVPNIHCELLLDSSLPSPPTGRSNRSFVAEAAFCVWALRRNSRELSTALLLRPEDEIGGSDFNRVEMCAAVRVYCEYKT